jgi:hypothetical protein
VREGHLEIAKLLLKRGAEVDVLDPDDFTPLHNAAWNGNLEMTELLLDAGADIEASTYDGDTPLSLAQNNDQPQVAELIQAKLLASPVVDTKVGSTPVSDPGAINISGTYISEITYPRNGVAYAVRFVKKKNRKEITLEQTGNAISGFDSTEDPKIIGTREGNTIDFYVLLPHEIYGTWEINADGTEMVGKWSVGGRGLYGTWKLTKIESTAASDSGVRDVSGTYVMTNLTGNWGLGEFLSKPISKGVNEITIAQNGDQLTGTYSEGRGKLWGVIKGDTIKFDWAGKMHTGRGKWTFKPGSNESSVTVHTNSGSGEAKFNLTKIDTESP